MVSRLSRSNSLDDNRYPPSESGSPAYANDSFSPRIKTTPTGRWEDCINRVYARRRHHSITASGNGRERSRQKKISRNSCNNDRTKRQDLRPSLLRQTFASTQRYKPSQRS